MADTERLAKVIARAGVASRREAERLIEDGLVTVDGEVVFHPGTPVDARANVIKVRGDQLPPPTPLVYYLLYKPRGTITGRDDPEGRKSVLELVEGLPHRVEPVGRLDLDTEGALLLTNDGELAHALTHPRNEVPKRYVVKIWKEPDPRKMKRLERGIHLDDGKTAPARLRVIERTATGNCWIEITVTEGRNRLVRRMFETIGHPVSKLRRESFATLSIRGMERGDLRPLTGEEVARIRDIAEGTKPAEAGHQFRYKKGFAKPKPAKVKPLHKKRRMSKPSRGGTGGRGGAGSGGRGAGGGGGGR
jgi:23S rRNA pseudouridine2605 synthase